MLPETLTEHVSQDRRAGLDVGDRDGVRRLPANFTASNSLPRRSRTSLTSLAGRAPENLVVLHRPTTTSSW